MDFKELLRNVTTTANIIPENLDDLVVPDPLAWRQRRAMFVGLTKEALGTQYSSVFKDDNK